MVLKRKRGDEWVEVVKPGTAKSTTTSNASSSAKSASTIPAVKPSMNSASNSTRSTAGASLMSQPSYPTKPAIETPVTPPAKKPRTIPVASQHPMLASLQSPRKPAPYPSMSTSGSTPTSSQPTASQSSANTTKKSGKGGKKGTATGGEASAAPAEKRLARFKPSCPNNISDRLARVREQTFYLLDRTGRPENTSPTSTSLSEEFKVSGSTGNVYTVIIDKLPRCSCPDSQKGNHCKHILFIFTKVLQVAVDSVYWFQKALLSTELSSIFSNAPLAPNAPTNPRMQAEYNRVTGRSAGPSTSSQTRKKMPEEGDDCPICYDSMHGVAEKKLVWCEGCGNAVHQGCFSQWSTTARSSGKEVTCVWCRTRWILPAAAGGAGAGVSRTTSGGYLNLGGVGGVSPVRDTSSYYHGPRRGQRYHGAQYYGDD